MENARLRIQARDIAIEIVKEELIFNCSVK
jgi:hypothetical protein